MNITALESRSALEAAVLNGTKVDFVFFWGHRKPADGTVTRSCFSQWYEATFRVDDALFRTAEHYMMYRKARLFGDEAAAQSILSAATANEAKSLGRRVRGFSEERWCAHREEIVFTGNLAKFSQRAELRRVLLATENSVLVEASPTDTIWGIGMTADNPLARDPSAWYGANLLGFALMKVRARLRNDG